MKKILVFLVLLVSLKSFGQYPGGGQTLGNDSTLITVRGALKGRIINKVFDDTTQANTQRIKFYDGAQIYTKVGGGTLWLRDSTLNKWVQAGGASGILANSVINNNTDSILYRLSIPFAQPDTLYGSGHSFVNPGTEATTYDSSIMGRATALYGLPFVNMGTTSSGTVIQNQTANARIQPGNKGMLIRFGWDNDAWRGSPSSPSDLSRIKVINKMVNGSKAMYINFNLKSFTSAGSTSVIKTGTWSAFDATTYGGKVTNGRVTQTANDSIVYTFSGESNIAWTMIACDSINIAGARFTAIVYEFQLGGALVSTTTYGTNNQTDGVSDGTSNNQRSPMGFVITGLSKTKTYKIKLVSNQSTNFLYVDYFGHLVDPAYAKPFIMFHPVKATAAGYAILGTGYNSTLVDTYSGKMDSLKTELDTYGLPVYVVASNTYYDPATGSGTDGFHPSNTGFRQLYNGLVATFPSLQLANNGTIFNGNGQLYGVINGNARLLGADFGTGLTFNSGLVTNNLSTGVPGGQTMYGGTLTGNNLTIKSNTLGDGDVLFGANSTWRESTNLWGFGKAIPLSTVDILNTRANTNVIMTIKGVASQSGDYILMEDNAGNPVTRIGGGMKIFGELTALTGNGLEFGFFSNQARIQAYDRGASAHRNMLITALDYDFQTNGSSALTGSSAGVWKMPLTPTITDSTGYYAMVMKGTDGQISKIHFPFIQGSGGGGSGTVTSVDLAYGITGSTDPITTTGTVILDTTIAMNKAGAQVVSGIKNFTSRQLFSGQDIHSAGLTINGPRTNADGFVLEYVGGNTATITVHNGSFQDFQMYASNMHFYGGGSNPIAFSSGGNLGVGVVAASTTAKLHVVDNAVTTGTAARFTSSTLTSGSLATLTSTSTAANSFSLLNIASSGANATASRQAWGALINVANTGTTSQNIGALINAQDATTNIGVSATAAGGTTATAGSFAATGATNNNAIITTAGNSGFLVSSPTSALHTTSFATKVLGISALRTLDGTDQVIEVTANTFNVTLPLSTTCDGRAYTITNSGSGVTTILTTSSEVFRNVTATPTSLQLNQFQTVTVVSANGAWLRTSSL